MGDAEEARPSKKSRGDDAGSGLTAFALRAAKQLISASGGDDGGGENLVFSPLSIYAALTLVAAGARGATLDELLAVLGARSLDELAEFARGVAARALADLSGSGGGPLVAFACGVWHDEKVALKPDYCTAAVEVYNAETCAVDFRNKKEEAREEINRRSAGPRRPDGCRRRRPEHLVGGPAVAARRGRRVLAAQVQALLLRPDERRARGDGGTGHLRRAEGRPVWYAGRSRTGAGAGLPC